MAIDPWDDPIEEIKLVREAQLRRREESTARRVEYDRLEQLWEQAGTLSAAPQTFLALGEQLHKRGYEFWIELTLLIVRRAHDVRKLDRPNERAAHQRAVGQFLLAACRGEDIADLLAKMRLHLHDSSFNDLVEGVHASVSMWIGTKNYPATPHMTRQELVAACKSIPGMSNPSIGRAMHSGKITTEDPIGEFSRFSHADPETQMKILSACMEFLSPEKKS